VVDILPHKSEVHRIRLDVGGNLIQYSGDVSTCSTELTTFKCLWNSTISTAGETYMRLDVNNFYLGTPMDSFKYMCIPIKLIPHEIFEEYNLLSLMSDGNVYIEVQKGMYAPPLSQHSCKPTPFPPYIHPWIPPNQIQSRSMAPCNTPHLVLPCDG
jgi:hypothetical protein